MAQFYFVSIFLFCNYSKKLGTVISLIKDYVLNLKVEHTLFRNYDQCTNER